jgi:hypothetical protein
VTGADGDGLRLLLDRTVLEGQHETATRLRPERAARPVATGDVPGVLAEIAHLCQTWGGAGQPLLPVTGDRIPAKYEELLKVEQIDTVGGLQDLAPVLPRRVRLASSADHPVLAVATHEPRDSWRPVQVVRLPEDDPWLAVYAAVLGVWPEAPDPALLDWAGLRTDVRFEDVLPVKSVHVDGSLPDLLARLDDAETLTPRAVSTMWLAAGQRPDTSYLGVTSDPLPRPWQARRAAGPNIVVVVSPGSVDDITLLWNLRAAHGDRHALPVGIPVDELTPDALRALTGRAVPFGFGGGKVHLISTTVQADRLRTTASAVPSVVVVAHEDLLTFGPAPARARSHLATWSGGRTRLAATSDADRDLLRAARGAHRQVRLVLDVTVVGSLLPADPTMRGRDFHERYQSGAAQVEVHADQQDTVAVSWPSSWTCLAAVARTRGLEVRESEAGLAAVTLLRAIGSIEQARWLAHQPLLSLLHRMAEASGMSWWKVRWTAAHSDLLAAGADPDALRRVAEEHGRDQPAVAPPGEGRAVPFQEFVSAVGSELAARNWVAWAERRHLLVRGADVDCPECRSRSWLPFAALPPPVVCPGCGRRIEQPHGPRDIRFSYRLGEPLRRALDTDSLGHVLALRWIVDLFSRRGLVGAHPGVTFRDPAAGRDVGEADVLLLFADGSLVPVEVKRRAAGADSRAFALMDILADAVDAPYDLLAVTEPARLCPSLAPDELHPPARPRLLLTLDQLLDPWPRWTLAADPFAWAPLDASQEQDRKDRFRRALHEHDPDDPVDFVEVDLLAEDPDPEPAFEPVPGPEASPAAAD